MNHEPCNKYTYIYLYPMVNLRQDKITKRNGFPYLRKGIVLDTLYLIPVCANLYTGLTLLLCICSLLITKLYCLIKGCGSGQPKHTDPLDNGILMIRNSKVNPVTQKNPTSCSRINFCTLGWRLVFFVFLLTKSPIVSKQYFNG